MYHLVYCHGGGMLTKAAVGVLLWESIQVFAFACLSLSDCCEIIWNALRHSSALQGSIDTYNRWVTSNVKKEYGKILGIYENRTKQHKKLMPTPLSTFPHLFANLKRKLKSGTKFSWWRALPYQAFLVNAKAEKRLITPTNTIIELHSLRDHFYTVNEIVQSIFESLRMLGGSLFKKEHKSKKSPNKNACDGICSHVQRLMSHAIIPPVIHRSTMSILRHFIFFPCIKF